MSRSTTIAISRYLQHRVREWVQSGRTGKELAQKAGVSTAQVSELLNEAKGVGWKTAEGVAKALDLSMHDLLTVSETWARANATTTNVTSPVALPPNALGRHPSWEQAAAAAREQHPEIESRHFDFAASLCVPGGLPERVDVPFVAGIVRELDALERRAAAMPVASRAIPKPTESVIVRGRKGKS